jgi:flagellar motility protein MotE (MotC chaperone)
MKPRDAALIFNELDSSVLVPVLDRMKESQAAPIMSAMQPDRARQVTIELASERKNANAAPAASADRVPPS